jgi:outer membrane protein W
VLLCILVPSVTLYAGQDHRFTVRGGPIYLKADDVEGDINLGGSSLPGASLSVDDELHYGLLLGWQLSSCFSLETIVSTPLEINIQAGGGMLGNEFLAVQIDVLPLMLIGQFTPQWDFYGVRPFLGLGAAYLWFGNGGTTESFDELGASLGLHNADVKVDNQLRPVIELGVDYLVGEQWFANFTWLYLQGKDDIEISFASGVELTSKVSYAPQFFALTLGYRF